MAFPDIQFSFSLNFFVGSHTSDLLYDTYGHVITVLEKIIPPPYVSMQKHAEFPLVGRFSCRFQASICWHESIIPDMCWNEQTEWQLIDYFQLSLRLEKNTTDMQFSLLPKYYFFKVGTFWWLNNSWITCISKKITLKAVKI